MRAATSVFWILSILCGFGARSGMAEPNDTVPEFTTSKIFDDGSYNCFTDLTQFNNVWYCTFRSAISHGDPSSGVIGSIVVIRSVDLIKWHEIARFHLDRVDLRDPKLTVAPNEIRVYAVAGEISDAGILQYCATRWRSADGLTWSEPKQMCPGYIFWRPRWHEGKFYVPAYLRRPDYCGVDLLVSENGDDWRLHSTPVPPTTVEAETLWANECDLLFLPEGRSLLFSRRNQGIGEPNSINKALGGFRRGYVGLSDSGSMSAWKSINEDLYFHAPATLFHRGKIYLAGRDMVRLKDGATETCRLWTFDLKAGFSELAHFKTHGDCSYPGIVAVNDHELAVSYYSCHEGMTAYFDKPGKSDIYLARVPIRD
jgi:hypothetical protein